MNILSLNLNNFGGLSLKPVPKDYKNSFDKVDMNAWCNAVDEWRNLIDSNKNISKIMEYIKNRNIDIYVFQEFDINSVAGKHFIKELMSLGYEIVYPNTYGKDDFKRTYSSITVMFIRIEYKIQPYNFSKKISKYWKNVEINVGNRRIIGVHVPLGHGKYWDSMIKFYKNKNEEDKLLIIGDMNVYDLGTPQMKKFTELLSLGAIDTWLKRGNPNDRPTANSNKRIDYAIMTPSLYSELLDVDICDDLRNECVTDHSAIMVEVKKFN